MTFGFSPLLKGFDFLIAVIGLFGIGEILQTMEEGLAFRGKSARINLKVVLQTWGECRKLLAHLPALRLRRLLDGHHARRRHAGVVHELRHGQARVQEPAELRQGRDRGRGRAGDANNAAGTAALLPMLTLGIPGSPTAAVLLGGLLIWGLQPGPMLFVEQKDFVWGLIASMYLGNIVGLIVVLTCVPWWAAILRIPFSIIGPVIIVICAIGAYTVNNAMFDVWS
jgi:putative tricarboxylic transport membrane protein